MSLPEPPVELKDHCSVVHDDILYVYTPQKFLFLPLKRDAKWRELPMSEVYVQGAVCVKGGVNGDPNNAGLYLVGGKSFTSPGYLGLQQYSFADKKWQVISPVTSDLQNRVKHDAIYINSSASILVFSGTTTDNYDLSPSTFLVETQAPFNVRSFNSYVPPSMDPTLLPWGDDAAVMVGGSPGNTKVFSFGSDAVWKDTGASLVQPLKPKSDMQAAMVLGSDGSKVLETFDMSVSPNAVARYVLVGAGGAPAAPGQQVGAASTKKKPQRRDLTLSDYPPYDNSNAPTTIRNQFSLAQDGNGMVVISGGNDDDDPLSIFNQADNSWVDANQLFIGDNQKLDTSSTTSSSTATSTSATASSTSISTDPASTTSSLPSSTPAAPGGSSHSRTMTIVGATLGAILGFAAVLIIILLLIAWKKRRNKYGNGGRYRGDDKDRLSFQDQGMEPLTHSIQPMGRGPVPSADSWAIMAGRVDDKPYKPSPPPNAGIAMTALDKETGRSPLRNMQTIEPDNNTRNLTGHGATTGDTNRRTDEGWSKYFQDEKETQLLRGDSTRSGLSAASSEYTKSDYRNSVWPHGSAEVAPLDLSRLGDARPIGRVQSGSPSTEHSPKFGANLAAHQPMSAKISSGDSISIASDEYEDDKSDAFSSGVPASVNDHQQSHWTPMGGFHNPDRVPSSNYSESVFQSGPETRGDSGLAAPGNSNNRMTQWPEYDQGPNRKMSSDVSWLNLGGNR